MPQQEMRKATLAAGNADLMLAVGSSLLVYPAAGLPLLARDNGAVFLILNRGETGLDDEAIERLMSRPARSSRASPPSLARRVN